jgi:hypothetical protein
VWEKTETVSETGIAAKKIKSPADWVREHKFGESFSAKAVFVRQQVLKVAVK